VFSRRDTEITEQELCRTAFLGERGVSAETAIALETGFWNLESPPSTAARTP
jgi:hypothetical protein